MYSGVGTFTWPDGSMFVGKWENNKPLGDGAVQIFNFKNRDDNLSLVTERFLF